MVNRRGTLWVIVMRNKLSVVIGFSIASASFALGAAGTTDPHAITMTLEFDQILRYVVQPLILLLLAVLGWFVRSAYASIQDGIRKIHEKVDDMNGRLSYLEGANSINSKES